MPAHFGELGRLGAVNDAAYAPEGGDEDDGQKTGVKKHGAEDSDQPKEDQALIGDAVSLIGCAVNDVLLGFVAAFQPILSKSEL